MQHQQIERVAQPARQRRRAWRTPVIGVRVRIRGVRSRAGQRRGGRAAAGEVAAEQRVGGHRHGAHAEGRGTADGRIGECGGQRIFGVGWPRSSRLSVGRWLGYVVQRRRAQRLDLIEALVGGRLDDALA